MVAAAAVVVVDMTNERLLASTVHVVHVVGRRT
jgi:hypothetical protein